MMPLNVHLIGLDIRDTATNFQERKRTGRRVRTSNFSWGSTLAVQISNMHNFVFLKAFMRMFTRDHVFWIGLKKKSNQPWKWLDGEN
ncbi:hypothetical protein E2320_014726 [Naja naja]|nr:hypothetical protein E2320_014726 [Naja naja]